MTSGHDSPSPMSPAVPGAPLALVAGGSRGLGLLMARELGARGHRLALCARNPEELAEARRQLAGEGYEVYTEVCDVADADAVAALVDDLERRVGPIEVAVANAGVIQVGPLASLTRAHFTEAVDIMLWGPVNLALALSRRMTSRRRGRIGVISSIGGLIAVPHLLPYSTAKFAATGFASGLRAELAGTGVKVTTVAPGLMRTGSHIRAKFVGKQAAEYAWFTVSDSLPGLSMDAEVAAKKIVDGVLAGRAWVVLTPLANLGMRVNGLAPSLVSFGTGVMSRLLPKAPAADRTGTPSGDTVEGWEAEAKMRPGTKRALDKVTTLTRRASERFNERSGRR